MHFQDYLIISDVVTLSSGNLFNYNLNDLLFVLQFYIVVFCFVTAHCNMYVDTHRDR